MLMIQGDYAVRTVGLSNKGMCLETHFTPGELKQPGDNQKEHLCGVKWVKALIPLPQQILNTD